jgi:hypothetical protein
MIGYEQANSNLAITTTVLSELSVLVFGDTVITKAKSQVNRLNSVIRGGGLSEFYSCWEFP